MKTRRAGREASAKARQAAHSEVTGKAARLGYVTKGILYATVGVLAVRLAVGDGGRATDTRGAMDTLSQSTLGELLLWVVALGLVGMVLWRAAAAVFDAEGEGTGKKAWVKRAGKAVSGVVHASLLVAALRVLLGNGSAGSGSSAQSWTAKLLEMPFGQVLVAAVGAVIIGYGVSEVVNGVKRKFERKLALNGAAARHAHWVKRVATFGLVARGSVFALVGGFLVYAAATANPDEARGLGEGLATLASQPYGTVLLFVAAVGLVTYAAYAFVQAAYRRLPSA